MKPIDLTPASQTDTLVFAFDLPHPPEKVWRALTEPELVSAWLLPVTGLRLEPGARFTLQTQAFPGWDGTVACRVVEVEPQRRLRYTWVALEIDTVVTFVLEPTATGTRLTLEQAGFRADQRQAFGGARYGWGLMGGRLIELLGRPA